MSKNPLSDWLADETSRRGRPVISQADALREANAKLAEMGRNDVHWFLHEGRMVIGWKR